MHVGGILNSLPPFGFRIPPTCLFKWSSDEIYWLKLGPFFCVFRPQSQGDLRTSCNVRPLERSQAHTYQSVLLLASFNLVLLLISFRFEVRIWRGHNKSRLFFRFQKDWKVSSILNFNSPTQKLIILTIINLICPWYSALAKILVFFSGDLWGAPWSHFHRGYQVQHVKQRNSDHSSCALGPRRPIINRSHDLRFA